MSRSEAQRQWSRRRWLLAFVATIAAFASPLALRAVPIVHPPAPDGVASAAIPDTQRGDAHNDAPQALVQQHAIAPHGDSTRMHGVTGGFLPSTAPHGLHDVAALPAGLVLLARVVAASWRSSLPPNLSSRAARAPPAVLPTA